MCKTINCQSWTVSVCGSNKPQIVEEANLFTIRHDEHDGLCLNFETKQRATFNKQTANDDIPHQVAMSPLWVIQEHRVLKVISKHIGFQFQFCVSKCLVEFNASLKSWQAECSH